MTTTTREDIVEVNASFFYEKFKWHKDHETIDRTEQVLLRDLDYYKNECMLFLMTKDYGAGLALENSGRIISVFRGETEYRGVGKILLDMAIERGGCKLECNDVEMLRNIYGKNGFVPVSTSDLDKNDVYYSVLKEKENEVDHGTRLIFWVFDKRNKQLLEEKGGQVLINFAALKDFKDELEAEEFRDSVLENIDNPSEELKEYLLKIIDDYMFGKK